MPAKSISLILSPYHVGIRDHRVGDGPNRILKHGLIRELESLGISVDVHEIERVDDFEGEIGRSFEVLRRTSTAVSAACKANAFPLILSGNCMSLVGIAAGLGISEPGIVYFDAHADLDTTSDIMSGYMDVMGMSMLRGKSWHSLVQSIPGHHPLRYDRLVFCGLRDLTDEQRKVVDDTVEETGTEVIWGDTASKPDFAKDLSTTLERRSFSPAMIHLDLDVLDESVGIVNGWESPGGLQVSDLMGCMDLIPKKTKPASLTVCSFNPNLGDGDKIAKIGVQAVITFVKTMLETGTLSKQASKHT